MQVTLTDDEMALARVFALLRKTQSEYDKRSVHRTYEDGFCGMEERELLGVSGEIVVAKALDLFWVPTVNNFDAPDVHGIHVRATDYEDGHLLLRKRDDLDCGVYALVTGTPRVMTLRGFISGRSATERGEWRVPTGKGKDKESALWVKQEDLTAPEEALPILRKRLGRGP
jgi:hypothetical protein